MFLKLTKQKVQSFLGSISQFPKLQKLELWSYRKLARSKITDADDEEFRKAKSLMSDLRTQKLGLGFQSIKIHQTDSAGFNSWSAGRIFESRMNESGEYEQTASE